MLDNCIIAIRALLKNEGTMVSTAISIISLFVTGSISFIALRRTKIFQDYEYKVRLQLSNSRVALGSKSFPEVRFSYSAQLENTGLKPVEIIRVDICRGLIDDSGKRDISTVLGRTYLKSGESENIDYKLTSQDISNTMAKHNIEQCAVFIFIYYKDHKGKTIEIHRLLGGIEKPNVNIFVLQDGTAIT